MVKNYDSYECEVILNNYTIILAPSFWKSLKKIDKSFADRVSTWIYQDLVLPSDKEKKVKVKPLLGNLTGQHRIRLGKYRIIVVIDNNKLIFTFVKIAHRKDVYK